MLRCFQVISGDMQYRKRNNGNCFSDPRNMNIELADKFTLKLSLFFNLRISK